MVIFDRHLPEVIREESVLAVQEARERVCARLRVVAAYVYAVTEIRKGHCKYQLHYSLAHLPDTIVHPGVVYDVSGTNDPRIIRDYNLAQPRHKIDWLHAEESIQLLSLSRNGTTHYLSNTESLKVRNYRKLKHPFG